MSNVYAYNFGDSFTDTDGVLLEAHTPDSGTPFSWTRRLNGGNAAKHIEIRDGRLYIDSENSGDWQFLTAPVAPPEVSPGVYALEFDVVIGSDILGNGDGYCGIALLTDAGLTWQGYGLLISAWGDGDVEMDLYRWNAAGVTQNFEFGDFFQPGVGTHTIRLEVDTVNNQLRGYCDGVLNLSLSDSTFNGPFLGIGLYMEAGTPTDENRALEMTSIGTPALPAPGTLVLDRMLTDQTGVYA